MESGVCQVQRVLQTPKLQRYSKYPEMSLLGLGGFLVVT